MKTYGEIENIVITNGKFFSRNFGGEKFGPGGMPGFCVRIEDPEFANQLEDEGWNIKFWQSSTDPDDSFYYLPVNVSYRYEQYNPRIVRIMDGKKELMNAQNIKELDGYRRDQFKKINMTIRPRIKSDGSGLTAYLKAMTVEVNEDRDEYEKEYDNLPWTTDDLPFDID